MEPVKAVPGVDATSEVGVGASDGAGTPSLAHDADLVLSFAASHQITLHAVTPEGTRELGAFDDVLDAWAAVDRIDLESLQELLAEERAGGVDLLCLVTTNQDRKPRS